MEVMKITGRIVHNLTGENTAISSVKFRDTSASPKKVAELQQIDRSEHDARGTGSAARKFADGREVSVPRN